MIESMSITQTQTGIYGDVKFSDLDKLTPLHLAAANGHTEIAELLLQHKDIDVNKVEGHGKTPLDLAVQNGHGEIVRLLQESVGKSHLCSSPPSSSDSS